VRVRSKATAVEHLPDLGRYCSNVPCFDVSDDENVGSAIDFVDVDLSLSGVAKEAVQVFSEIPNAVD
jgi:hypothetical protein